MKTKRGSFIILLILFLVSPCLAAVGDPNYQSVPPVGSSFTTSGEVDLSGTGGSALVWYWVWDGGNGWYYYTYQIHNTDPCDPFLQYIKHLWITNPTGEEYIITGDSGGYQFDELTGTPTDIPGPAWDSQAWSSEQASSSNTMVKWESSGNSNLYPGKISWEDPRFQFVSKMPPAITGVSVRQGSYTVSAHGLITAPGLAAFNPRSPGYWKHQCGTKGKAKERDLAPGYLVSITSENSDVFNSPTTAEARDILTVTKASDYPSAEDHMRALAKRQLLALWLNLVSGKLMSLDHAFTFEDPLGVQITKTVEEIITQVESTINNGTATLAELEYVKDLAEIVNLM